MEGTRKTSLLIPSILLVMGLLIYGAWAELGHERTYKRDAIETTGKVAIKYTTLRGRRYMSVSFADYTGQRYRVRYQPSSRGDWKRIELKGVVQVWYVPSDPRIFSIEVHEYKSRRQAYIGFSCAAGFFALLIAANYFRRRDEFDQTIIDAALRVEPIQRA